MTAVQWFFRWVNDNPEATHKEYAEAFEQAKEMEKKEHEKIYDHAFNYGVASSQTEISDEEIIKYATENGYYNEFLEACRWYREQLKLRQNA